MRVVVALGGNALLKRGQALSAENQRVNVKTAAKAIAGIMMAGHEIVISHGNGPQVGILALQNAAYKEGSSYPLDVLSAESIGMIGYLIEQELDNLLPDGKLTGTLLTQIEVDPKDPAFDKPSKPIGPLYDEAEALEIGKARGWVMGRDGNKFRRLVASPLPKRIFQIEVIRLLVNYGVTVICAGGGGIPVIRLEDGSFSGDRQGSHQRSAGERNRGAGPADAYRRGWCVSGLGDKQADTHHPGGPGRPTQTGFCVRIHGAESRSCNGLRG